MGWRGVRRRECVPPEAAGLGAVTSAARSETPTRRKEIRWGTASKRRHRRARELGIHRLPCGWLRSGDRAVPHDGFPSCETGGVSDPPRQATAYARVSTEDQADEGLGITAQIDVATAAIAERDWVLVAEVVDAGVSGSVAPERRPALGPALEALDVAGAAVGRSWWWPRASTCPPTAAS